MSGQKSKIVFKVTKNCELKNYIKKSIYLGGKLDVIKFISKTRVTKYKLGKWTKEEDFQLMELINKYGHKWSCISKVLKTRSGKQIRNRYLNILSPKISKEKFSLDEDLKIHELYPSLGNRWREYVPFFKGRSSDNIKNRYNSSIKTKDLQLRIIQFLGDSVPSIDIETKEVNTKAPHLCTTLISGENSIKILTEKKKKI